MPKNNYLSIISLNEFNQVLKLYDVNVSKLTQQKMLHAFKNNVFALVDDGYTCVLEEYLYQLTAIDRKKIKDICAYFKPLVS